jgi:hypothetical protein
MSDAFMDNILCNLYERQEYMNYGFLFVAISALFRLLEVYTLLQFLGTGFKVLLFGTGICHIIIAIVVRGGGDDDDEYYLSRSCIIYNHLILLG